MSTLFGFEGSMSPDAKSEENVELHDAKRTSEQGSNLLESDSLKYSLLGPSLLKAGQESVDQTKVSEIIYNASKGSKFFEREEERDRALSLKIEKTLALKQQLERLDLSHDLRVVDGLISELEETRDLTQYIVHVDCDAFYAAVELLDRPELAELPFAVGGGVLTTCNYVARTYGCRSGMAGFVAKKLCPQLVLLKPDFTKYASKAEEIRQILADYDPRFESASIDEAYLNITPYCLENNLAPADVVEKLRKEVAEKTKVTVSAGIAANTRLAKICSNMHKPNGQFVLPNDRSSIIEFVNALPCRKVNGIGRVFERELAAVGIKTCGDVYSQRMYLSRLFGEKACTFLIHVHLGLGRTRVQPSGEYERKSVGTESTFSSLSNPSELRQKLRHIAGELENDLQRASFKGRTLVLKIKLHTFEVHTRQVALPRPTNLADELYKHAVPMLAKFERDMPHMTLRLMGLRCTNLVSTTKPDTYAFFGELPSGDNGLVSGSRSAALDERRCSSTAKEVGRPSTWRNNALGGQESQTRFDVCETPSDSPEACDDTGGLGARTGCRTSALSNWCCPVCSRPQPADEKTFNIHIDACLSRRTIFEALRESKSKTHSPDSGIPSPATRSIGTRPMPKKKRGRPVAEPVPKSDPRQKKICFKSL